MQAPPAPQIEIWPGLTPYAEAVERMERYVQEVLDGGVERVVFCEHEAVITLGSSARAEDVAGVTDIPIIESGRGGQATYHGPGQRVVYLIVDLARWGKDVRAYVKWLQKWLILSLQELDISSYVTDDIGVWMDTPRGAEKIAAVGIRVRRGVAYHGISLNVHNDLGIYRRFVPCGIADKGVARIGDDAALMARADAALKRVLAEKMPARA